MPDDSPLPPHADFPATEAGLEFIMEQISGLPTRWELTKYSFVILAVGARASNAAFLDSEVRNAASLSPSDDMTSVAVVALVFAGALACLFAPSRRVSPPTPPGSAYRGS